MDKVNKNYVQIGDWLKHANGKYYQVTRIDLLSDGNSINFACGTPHLWNYNNKFEPIPITGELLLKNGFELLNDKGIVFKENTETYSFFNSEDNIVLSIFVGILKLSKSENTIFITIQEGEIDSEYQETIQYGGIQYLHELQHALRLFGIDDEFEL